MANQELLKQRFRASKALLEQAGYSESARFICHELRTPLTSIQGALDLLLNQHSSKPWLEKFKPFL